MPVTFRRLYGWDGEEWIKVKVDEDGNLLAASNTDATISGVLSQRVSDLNGTEALGEILNQLKIMNLQLSLLTDTEIQDGDL